MKYAKILIIPITALLIGAHTGDKPMVKRLKVSEPSDICRTDKRGEYMLLADKAYVYTMNENGEILNTFDFLGYDLEGICSDDRYYYISEESFQAIHVIDKLTHALVSSIPLIHHGGRNEGVEAITRNLQNGHFLAATEKDPQMFYECDENWRPLRTFQIAGINEVSALTWYEEKLYVLSDEDYTIYKVDPANYQILGKMIIKVVNPEGITFNEKGEILIVSDDMARLFTFKPEFV